MFKSIIIIDPEYEYKYLAEAVGGTYVNISLSRMQINPFDLPRSIGVESKPQRYYQKRCYYQRFSSFNDW